MTMRILLALSLLLSTSTLFAQFPEDALRYSFVFPQGSARFAGTGGALTPMGADYTTLHTNPAGIGGNRFNSLHITPGFTLSTLETNLDNDPNGPVRDDAGSVFTLPSLGIVWAKETRSLNWPTFNFGIGLTRTADFNETIEFEGFSRGTIFDAIAEDLNDFDAGAIGLGDIRFRADLFRELTGDFYFDDLGDGNGERYFSFLDLPENFDFPVNKEGTTTRSGSMNEATVGFGGSYREVFTWGASIGLPFFNFTESRRYDEFDVNDQLVEFDDGGFDTDLESSGSGVNFKFGVIVRPTDGLRVSAAIHTPTFWTIDESYETTLTYNYTFDGEAFGGQARSDRAEYTYNLQTPFRFLTGVGYLVGTKGFISADLDYTNYAGNSISFEDFSQADEATNADIDAQLGSSIGLRVGGEANLKPFQVRAGVGYRQLPYTEFNEVEDEAILTYSGGVGYARGKFFVDVAAQYEGYQTFFRPYQVFGVTPQVVTTDRTRLSLLVSVGYRGF